MVSLLVMVLAALPVYWAFSKFTRFRRNLKDAKSTGLPYVIQRMSSPCGSPQSQADIGALQPSSISLCFG
jgi:hypothetical protein